MAMYRMFFVLPLVFLTGCVSFIMGETEGERAVQKAQAYAMRAYAKQYTPDNITKAAAPFPNIQRFEAQAPPATSIQLHQYGYGGGSLSIEELARTWNHNRPEW